MRNTLLILGAALVAGLALYMAVWSDDAPEGTANLPASGSSEPVTAGSAAPEPLAAPPGATEQGAPVTPPPAAGAAGGPAPPVAPRAASSVLELLGPAMRERVESADYATRLEDFFQRLDYLPDQATAERITLILLEGHQRCMTTLEAMERDAGDLRDPAARIEYSRRRQEYIASYLEERRAALKAHIDPEVFAEKFGAEGGGDEEEGF